MEMLSIYNSNISLTSLTMIVAMLISSLLSLSSAKWEFDVLVNNARRAICFSWSSTELLWFASFILDRHFSPTILNWLHRYIDTKVMIHTDTRGNLNLYMHSSYIDQSSRQMKEMDLLPGVGMNPSFPNTWVRTPNIPAAGSTSKSLKLLYYWDSLWRNFTFLNGWVWRHAEKKHTPRFNTLTGWKIRCLRQWEKRLWKITS